MRRIDLIVHNVRSAHNVGSILRTADGLGVQRVYLTGYTPYPIEKIDERLPHMAQKAQKQITKTALGAEKSNFWQHHENIFDVILKLKGQKYLIVALEQTAHSSRLADFHSTQNIGLIVGNEVTGIETPVLDRADIKLQIPMKGIKESFNVSIAAAIALYHLKFYA